jgi:hypothetical protein
MTTKNGNDGRDMFRTPPAADEAPVVVPVNTDPIQPDPAVAVGGWKKFFEENKYYIGGVTLIVILLLLLMFLGGLLIGKNKDIDAASTELNQATIALNQAASAVTLATEGDGSMKIELDTFRENEGGITEFFAGVFSSMFTTLCSDGEFYFCKVSEKSISHKVYLTGDQAQLIADTVANHVQQGGNPEELARLRKINADIATQSLGLTKRVGELEGQLKNRPAPQLVAPVTDPTVAVALAKLAAGQEETNRKLAESNQSIKVYINQFITSNQQAIAAAKESNTTCKKGTSYLMLVPKKDGQLITEYLMATPATLNDVRAGKVAKGSVDIELSEPQQLLVVNNCLDPKVTPELMIGFASSEGYFVAEGKLTSAYIIVPLSNVDDSVELGDADVVSIDGELGNILGIDQLAKINLDRIIH